MNRYLISIVISALLVVLTSSTALASATCNCAAQTCVSGGQTWPISSCAECNGVCGSSSGSGATAGPANTTFLKGKYDVPAAGTTKPLDIVRVLPPVANEWEKKRQQAALLESEQKRLREEAGAAGKAFEEAKRRRWKAEDKLEDAKKLLAAAKNLTKKDKEDLVYFAEKKFAEAEAELKKAQAEEQAAEKKKNEAWKKIDELEAQVRKLLKEAKDEEEKANEEARKEKLVGAAKEKLATLKNQSDVQTAVKAAEAKAAEKKAAEAKAAKEAAEAQKKIEAWIDKLIAAEKQDIITAEQEAEYDKFVAEGNKLAEDKREADNALFDAENERINAEEEAAAMREAAKRLG